MDSISFKAHSSEETAKLAACLSSLVRGGDVVLLAGDLAAGKTHFVNSFVSACGSQASVSSPTYTIAHHYKTEKYPVLHIDAYRLSGPDEFRDLTLEDFYDKSALLIEWGDIVAGVFPEFLRLDIQFCEDAVDSRDILITAQGQRWRAELENIANALGELGEVGS